MLPFDGTKLERLMDAAGMHLLLASTRHNVRYLTGGYFFHFHAQATRMGTSQYLPFVGLPSGRLDEAFYIGRPDEHGQIEAEGLWVRHRLEAVRGTRSAAHQAAEAARGLGLAEASVGVELPFLPADALLALREALPGARFLDATPVLDELRAVKSTAELAVLRTVYDRTAEAIQAAFAAARPGITTRAVARQVHAEMARRGLTFLWAFTCAGPGRLRAPSGERWELGRVLHIDAGGEEGDYLADICRMGVLGDPPPLARDLHQAWLEVQDQVRRIVRAGVPCAEVLQFGELAVRQHRLHPYGRFVAHGIGMVSHEQPEISGENLRPLEAGMVLSIETEFIHPEVGHVKIEDAVAVTGAGCDGLGDEGRELQVVRG